MTLTADQARSKIKQGTDTWYESAFRQHWSRVYGVIYRLVGDPAEAEDLALETFWRLYRRPPSLDEGRELGGWLYRVATNLGYNALRSRKRRQRYEEQAGSLVVRVADPPDPASEIELSQERQQVRAVLAKMKPRSAKLLVLRYSGLSYAEIAAALGLAPGSVGTFLARAEEEFERRYRRIGGD